jgi:hypothetical protein
MLGFCLTAVLMLGTLLVTGASAGLPEWGHCVKTGGGTGGRYVDAACTVRAHGKGHPKVYEGGYEWVPAAGETQVESEELELTGSFSFETQAGEKIECTAIRPTSSVMVFLARSAVTPFWRFTGCTSKGEPCLVPSVGANEEEINDVLQWFEEQGHGWDHPTKLGFVEGRGGVSPVVGLSFTSDNSGFEPSEGEGGEAIAPGTPERFFAPIVCGGEEPGPESIGTVWIGGEKHGHNTVIGTLAPVNEMSSRYTLTYGESSPGHQTPEAFAHGSPRYLQAFLHNHWERVAFVGQINVVLVQPAELKATR